MITVTGSGAWQMVDVPSGPPQDVMMWRDLRSESLCRSGRWGVQTSTKLTNVYFRPNRIMNHIGGKFPSRGLEVPIEIEDCQCKLILLYGQFRFGILNHELER
jgi:hypothetical protein